MKNMFCDFFLWFDVRRPTFFAGFGSGAGAGSEALGYASVIIFMNQDPAQINKQNNYGIPLFLLFIDFLDRCKCTYRKLKSITNTGTVLTSACTK